MASNKFSVVVCVLLVTQKCTGQIFTTTSPWTTTGPLATCEDNYNYIFAKVECRIQQNGAWHDINLDPAVCSGWCELPPPCDQQANFIAQKNQCISDPTGNWIVTNYNPSHCDGYCDYITTQQHQPRQLLQQLSHAAISWN